MFREEFKFTLQRFADINNSTGNKSVNGTSSADMIVNIGNSVTINGAAGSDYIYNNEGQGVSINGGAGDDSIQNGLVYVSSGYSSFGANSTIDGSAGNDYINNICSSNVLFQYRAGDGFDIIEGFNATSTLSISGDEYTTQRSGSDIIVNVGDGKITLKGAASLSAVNIAGVYKNPFNITGTEGADTIYNTLSGVTINALGGNDSIRNSGDNVTIDSGAGEDTISNSESSNVSIDAGAGQDSISNSGSLVTIDAGADNDSIQNFGTNDLILGGDGNDSISNSKLGYVNGEEVISDGGKSSTILGGDGNDYIRNSGDNVTIDGGQGNDYIYNSGGSNVLFNYMSGDGYDTIVGFNATSTLQITNGTYFSQVSGTDIVVSVGSGAITLVDAATLSAVNIAGTYFNPFNVVGTSWADTLYNTLDGAMIQALGGNDYITNWGNNTTIEAGTGSDIIQSYGQGSKLYGGDGHDYISAGLYNNVDGGAGDDSIYLGQGTVSGGTGNDYISVNNGYNLIQYTSGDGYDTVEGFKGTDRLQIGGGTGTYSTQMSGTDIVVKVGSGAITLVDAATLSAVNIAGEYKPPLNVEGTSGADTINNTLSGATINALDGNDLIVNSGYHVSIEAGAGNDFIINDGGSQATINAGSGDDYIYNSGSNVLFTYTTGEGFDTINGFNATSTLKIAGGTYFSQISGKNILVTVGSGAITLVDAATLSAVNIAGTYFNPFLITGTAGADTIYNTLSGATINALGGNDTIENGWWDSRFHDGGSFVSINGGAGSDYISNWGSNVSISGSDGSDTISNDGNYSTISGGDGNDEIHNNASDSTIDAGDGNDYIHNGGMQVLIDAGSGDDRIENYGEYVTIDGGYGFDFILNYGSNLTINSGEGDDSIFIDYGSNVSIDAGGGDNIISLSSHSGPYYSGNILIELPDGYFNNTVYNFNEDDTLKIGDGTGSYFSQESGSDIVVMVGDGKITLVGAASLSAVNIDGKYKNLLDVEGTSGAEYLSNDLDGATINALGGDDTVYNWNSFVSIDGGTGNDKIYNSGYNVTIMAGAGNDSIRNYYGNYSTINGGTGNDTIQNSGASVTVDGGDGHDSIYNDGGDCVSISGGAGSDSINSWGSRVTIAAGAGNDFVDNGSAYSSLDGGSGSDSISNVSTNVTINAGTDDDSIQNSGSNVLFNYSAGDGNDSINGFNETSTLKIGSGSGTYSSQVSGSDILISVGDGVITLVGAASLKAVNIAGTYVNPLLLSGTSGADSIDNTLDGATINALGGDDTIANGGWWDSRFHDGGSNVSIKAGAGNDSIQNVGNNNTIDLGAGDDFIFNSDSDSVTIDGGSGNDYIDNNGSNNVSIDAGTGSDFIYNIGSNVTIDAGAGSDTIWNAGTDTTINAGAGNDSIQNSGSNVLFKYSAGDGNDSINGFNETSTLQIGGGVGTYSSQVSGSDIIVSVGSGKITLEGAASLDAVNIDGSDKSTPAWKLDGTTATYGTSSKTLVTVSGVKSFDGISISGTTVTVSKAALGTDEVTVSDDYTLRLGDDVQIPEISKGWTSENDSFLYGEYISDGYIINDDARSIFYVAALSNILFAISGVKSFDGLEVNEYDKTVTVSKSSLATDDVKISDGYTLALGSDVNAPTTKKSWTLDGTTATYRQTTTAGYKLSDNAITYTDAATENLITVSGVKSLDGLSLSGKILTVSKSSLATDDVKISDGYTLALGSDVSKPSTSKAWSLDGTTATYKQTTTAGYTLAGNAITYSKAATENLITVSGVKSTAGLSLSGKTLTVSKSSLATNDVKISDGYTLALGSDVSKPSTSKAWSLDGTTATYRQTTTAGYTLAGNAITYTDAATKNLITVSGISSDATAKNFYVNGNSITVGKAAVKLDGTPVKLLTSGYTLKLGSGMTAAKNSAASYSNGVYKTAGVSKAG